MGLVEVKGEARDSAECYSGSLIQHLSPEQSSLVESLAARLSEISGVRAVVLCGSYARGRARPDSDIDLGLYYSEASPFSIEAVRAVAAFVSDAPDPVVSDFYDWGPWVNGGSWLTIGGQRVDFLYRNLDQVERVIDQAEGGGHELCYYQHPPFGFFSASYLGELKDSVVLFDAEGCLEPLLRRVAIYPEALRSRVVQDYLWAAKFELHGWVAKASVQAEAYAVAACLTRAVNQLILVLFALNREYLVSPKTALADIATLARAPRDFAQRVERALASLKTPADRARAVDEVIALCQQTIELCGNLYRPWYQF